MSERFWRNLSTCFGWLAIGVFFALVTFSSSLEIKDLDLWLHLRMGWWICHHGYVPNVDVLSCTIAGKPWINHEWLFQVLIYQIQKAYGFNGLISMQSMVVAVTFLALLFLGYSRERQWLSVSSLLMVLMVYQTRFTIRPDIFSLLFFVLYIYFLSLHLNKRWVIYVMVFLQVLWSNMHGFFFFGPLLVMVAIFSEFCKRHLPLPYEWNATGRLNDEEYGRIKIILLLVMIACCVNPETINGALYPIHVFFGLGGDNKIFFQHIVELQRPITLNTLFTDQYIWYKVLIGLSGLSFVFNRRRIDISSLFIWLIFLVFSLVAIRNMIYFAVAGYMVLMVNVMSTPWENIVPVRFASAKFKYLTTIIFILVIMLWMMNYGMQMMNFGYFDFDTYMRKSEFLGVSKRVYPYKAVDFLVDQKIKGNFFNDFNSGAYLIGRAYPNIRVFIDGRTEEYGANFFENYQKIWVEGNPKVFEYFEHQDNITGAFLNNAHQDIPVGSLKMFHSFKNWAIVYLDNDAIIFLKQTPYNKPFIDRFGVDLNKWKPKSMDLMKLGTKRVDPYPFVSRAYILDNLGADKAALLELQEALKVAPDDGVAYSMMGKIYARNHDYKRAFESYRLGAMYTENSSSRLGLAEAYEHLKDYEGAIAQYHRLLDMAPQDIQGYLGITRCYALEGQTKKALELLAKAPKAVLEDKVDVAKIRDIISPKKVSSKKVPARIIKKITVKKAYDLKRALQ